MSDAVTNAEVEDVLSSIRRLVSEDKRPLQGHRPAPQSDRLVLTPALRVAALSSEEGQGAQEHVAGEDVLPLSADHIVAKDMPAGHPNSDAQVDAAAQNLLAPENDYSADPYHFDEDGNSDGESEELLVTFPNDDMAEIGHAGTDAIEEDRGILEPSYDLELEQERKEPDFVDDDLQYSAMQDEPVAQTVQSDPAANRDEGKGSSQYAENEDEADKAAALSAKIAKLETAIGDISGSWEHDEAGEGDVNLAELKPMVWEDNEPEDKGPAPRLHFAPMGQDARTPNDSLDQGQPELPQQDNTQTSSPQKPESEGVSDMDLPYDELLDEEALRDLVSEIVRSELQGALGERITRNVRKLVRREIHRALAAQDLE